MAGYRPVKVYLVLSLGCNGEREVATARQSCILYSIRRRRRGCDGEAVVHIVFHTKMTIKDDTHAITTLIVNHKDWTTQLLVTNMPTSTLVTISPYTTCYNLALEWANYYHYLEPSPQIHNMQTQPIKFRKHSITSQVDAYTIKPSNTWKTAPIVDIPLEITSMTPIPTEYNHIHPFKFHPQQCIYIMDPSFPPPKIPKAKLKATP